eukprot:CAMPEP_0178844162 /NCGR_PEP_ID=MMETSP0746-20121128/16617_1 /TAXON_ID=913974 /ORGANISM="Nitzschia punctata, Strain CCMP561" /LENGTH=180 /DNA_ID=CAMNT_0020507993 /DNA_START=8 /DNA_END=547 /DNA_ORIENTATION=+
MTFLKDSGRFPDMTLPDVAERILLESVLKQKEDGKREEGDHVISPFEMEAVEKRLIDLLESANRQNKDEIEKLIQRFTGLEPSNALVFALIDFYLRMKDADRASYWLQKLDSQSLKASSNLIDDVFLLWSAQRGPRTPWRADEVFRTISSLIRDLDNSTSAVNTLTFKLMLQIWSNSEDP